MSDNGWHWSLERSIPSNTEVGAELVQELMQQLEQCEWLQEHLFGINLAIEEALVNAIKHGNHEDANKRVHVAVHFDKDRFCATIADEGDGFDPGDVPDPTADENLDRPGGRGIMLMRNFMTRVAFNDTGNQVVLEKKLN